MVEEHLSCRQITKRLNTTQTPTPSGQNVVWQPSTVRAILSNHVYTGQARYNYRQSVLPQARRKEAAQRAALKTGRRSRPETEWVWSEAPALISPELFEKAHRQLQRNAELAHRQYLPSSQRYLLRRLVICGDCGLAMHGSHQVSRSLQKTYEYLYYSCAGKAALTRGRVKPCPARRGRAERLDAVVWDALTTLLQQPAIIPCLHQHWVQAKQHDLSTLTAQQEHLRSRQQQLARQSQRLLDAYQAELISLEELRSRCQRITTEVQQIGREQQRVTHAQQQRLHWHQVIEPCGELSASVGGQS